MDYSKHENNKQLAEIFRKHRTAKKMTVEEAAVKTGIPALHLISIENGNFEQFDAFYLKMYLKKYGTFLAVDMDEAYAQAYGVQQTEEAPAVIVKNPKPALQRKPRRTEGMGKIVGMILLAVAVVFGIYFGWDMLRAGMSEDSDPAINNPNSNLIIDSNDDTKDGEDEAAADDESDNDHAQAPVQETTVTVEQSDGSQQVLAIETFEPAVLTLTFTGTTWLGTNNGTSIPFENGELTGAGFTRNDGDVETVTVSESGSFYLNVPNLHLVEFKLNGEPLPIENDPRHQQITLNITIE